MKQKAIFLDRDGVINKERGTYTWLLKDFVFNDGLFEFLNIFNKKDYLFFVITNQGGIAKGVYKHSNVIELNNLMINTFKQNNIKITEIYYCPHHSVIETCLCRKPNSLMLEKAIAKYNIDKTNSYFIGDNDRDIIAGKSAGLTTIKIMPNDNLMNYLGEL